MFFSHENKSSEGGKGNLGLSGMLMITLEIFLLK